MAFIMPNIKNPNTNYFFYVTSVAWVEFYTGVDIFPNMDENFEMNYTSKVEGINWLKK